MVLAGNAFKNQCVKAKPEEETEKETSIPYGYEEGMTLSPAKAEKTVHFTSPPKPFNEDTLLAVSGISLHTERILPTKEVISPINCVSVCGSDVYEGKQNFYCSNRQCDFALWKENRF